MLRLPRRQGPSTSNFHNCSTSSGMGAYRSGFAYVVLSPLSLDFYYTNTGIQTNWWDDRRFMVGMRVLLVGHVRSTQWSWIKSSMSNRSSKSRQAPPSPLRCIRKSAGHLLYAAPKNREATNHGVNGSIAIGKQYSFAILFSNSTSRAWAIHDNVVWVPTRSLYNPPDSINGLAVIARLTIIKAGNNWCRTSVRHGCWPCDQYSVPIILKLHFGSCPCLEGSPLSGAKGSRQTDTEAHPQRGLLPK